MSELKINSPSLSGGLLSNLVFRTEDYEIKRWEFGSSKEQIHGWNDCFCFVLVTNGQYSFNISKNEYDTFTGHVIVEKPNFEYSLLPTSGKCTIINFSNSFYEKLCNEPLLKKNSFLSSGKIISQLLLSNPTIDYLHYKILTQERHSSRLKNDSMIFDLAYEVFNIFTNISSANSSSKEYKTYQLPIIERAKEYIHVNFKEDIGLQEIAENCFASPFHFSRLFRKFTLQSPYQYLLNIRLKHSEVLLKSTLLPIAEIAISSGFASPDYFATIFKKKYKLMPTDYRKKASSKKYFISSAALKEEN